jgi:hypothetical protein
MKTETARKPEETTAHTAEEKCQAVLALWTERRKPAEICREFSIKWATLSHWQGRAMQGLLQALEPRINLERGPLLSPRLQRLLGKRQHIREELSENTRKIKERLNRKQSPKPEKSPAEEKKETA